MKFRLASCGVELLGVVSRSYLCYNEGMDDIELLWSDFLIGRIAEYRSKRRAGLLKGMTVCEYLGMLNDEYGSWVADDVVSDRVKRVWQGSFDAWVTRGMKD